MNLKSPTTQALAKRIPGGSCSEKLHIRLSLHAATRTLTAITMCDFNQPVCPRDSKHRQSTKVAISNCYKYQPATNGCSANTARATDIPMSLEECAACRGMQSLASDTSSTNFTKAENAKRNTSWLEESSDPEAAGPSRSILSLRHRVRPPKSQRIGQASASKAQQESELDPEQTVFQPYSPDIGLRTTTFS